MSAANLPVSLSHAACLVLNSADAADKVHLTKAYAAQWFDGTLTTIGTHTPPSRPARPARPKLCLPGEMPRRRKGGTVAGRIALIHAIAHIEINAIDLAWDIIARFVSEDLPKEFYDDWVKVAYDEAVHFQLLEDRLGDFDHRYGDLVAHDGLWEAAILTDHDLMARLAIAPMVLEARGLDTAPPTVERLRRLGDDKTADIMAFIAEEEIAHVAAGTRWFEERAAKRGLDPVPYFHQLVKTYYHGQLKAPFNTPLRDQAGMDRSYYEPLGTSQERTPR